MNTSGYNLEGLRVLVCDDSRQIRSLINSFLSGFGIKAVEEANDADAAFERMVEFDPDLIITD